MSSRQREPPRLLQGNGSGILFLGVVLDEGGDDVSHFRPFEVGSAEVPYPGHEDVMAWVSSPGWRGRISIKDEGDASCVVGWMRAFALEHCDLRCCELGYLCIGDGGGGGSVKGLRRKLRCDKSEPPFVRGREPRMHDA